MDLDDSFTHKLFNRTKARKDYLKVKMRSALIEEQQIPDEGNKDAKESPKYLCVKQVTWKGEVKEENSMEEMKENVSVKQQEMRENNYVKKFEPKKEETPLRARGLAALRKKYSVHDDPNERKVFQDHQQVDRPLTYVFSTKSKELCSTRIRLARLAADIKGWENNLPRSNVKATSGSKEAPTAANKEVEDTLNSSFEPSNLPLSARKALFEQAAVENNVQSTKYACKLKVPVAQRAAIFENAPSNKFRTSHQNTANASPVKQTMKVGSPARLASASTGSPAKSSHAFIPDSPAKSSPAFNCDSPAKSSPAFCRDSPAKPRVTGGRSTTTPTKSFIPRPIIFSSKQQQAKTSTIEHEKKQPLSSLIDHWEKLSSNCPNNKSDEVAKK